MASMGGKTPLQYDHCNSLRHNSKMCFIRHPHLRVHGRGGNTRGVSSEMSLRRGIHYSAHHKKSEEHIDSDASTKGTNATEFTALHQLLSRMDTDLPRIPPILVM